MDNIKVHMFPGIALNDKVQRLLETFKVFIILKPKLNVQSYIIDDTSSCFTNNVYHVTVN